MKICFLIDDPSDIGGGPEHLRRVAKILREDYGAVVEVITPLSMDRNFQVQNFRHRVSFAFWVLKYILTNRFDLYHSHSFSTTVFLPVAVFLGRKTAVTVHGLGKNLTGGGVLNATPLPKLALWLILHWPVNYRFSAGDLDGFVTVGNGVDVEEFDREKAKPDRKHFTILCVGRHDPVKGVRFLESAVDILKQNYPRVCLNLVSGRRREAKDFKKANLYVLPSLSEGLPIVLLEAMAAKLPIVATDVGDCKKIVESAHCGLIVPPGDANKLVKSIEDIIKNADSYGENGYKFVRENYSWKDVAHRMIKVYSK